MRFLKRHIGAIGLLAVAAAVIAPGTAFSREGRSAPTGNGPRSIVAVVHCSYPPVSFRGANTGTFSGFSIDIVDDIARRAGLQVDYVCRDSWSEMVTAIEDGEADLGVLMKSAEREKVLSFSTPIEMTYLSFFARSQSGIDSDAALRGYTVGVVKGSMSYEQLKQRDGLKLQTENTYHEGLFQLLAGKIDLFAGEDSMILKSAREAGLDDRIKKVGKPFLERERCLAVRKDDVQLLGRLNGPLQDFVGSPEYQNIYLTWYGTPSPYWTIRKILVAGGLFLLVAVAGMAVWRYRSITRINRELRLQIAERRQAEERLKESEEKFRTIFENALDGIMIADLATNRHVEANRAICRMLGYTREELLALHVEDIHPRKDLPAVLDAFQQQIRENRSLATNVPMQRKDGTVFYADINAARITLDGKQCLIGVFRDITGRMLAEEKLRGSEQRLAESQRIAHIGSWEHNLTTRRVVWSDELFRLLGLDPEKDAADVEMFFGMVHPDDQSRLKASIEETVRFGKPFDIEYRFILRDGTVRDISARAELMHDETGAQNILRGTAQDITERKLTEEKIRRNEQFIRSILDTVDEGFIVIDRDYRILTANKAYCGQASLPCDEVIGKHCFEISHRTHRPCYDEGEECAVRRVFETGEPHSALHKHHGDGHVLYVETKAYPIKDAAGNITSVIETINNITEKHLLEEERLKTQKLESIGTLAGGIAHDFNNLLQGIFGYISMAKMTLDRPEKSLAMLEQAEKALQQSVNLTTQLLTFSRGGKPVKKPLRLAPVIESAAKFALSGSRAEFDLDVRPGLWQVNADAGQLGQVVQNIVLNADQAMPEGGKVAISARNIAAGDASLPSVLAPGNYIKLSIRDTGIGIPEQYLGKVFDPYFTTKEKGSGLGLATSYSIVRNHGGHIEVRSAAGMGTEFLLYLPALTDQPEEETATGPFFPAASRKARILVMDDEALVRDVAGELIRILGHDVDTAENGTVAVEKFRAARDTGRPFDIVILDLTVRGGMGGAEALAALFRIDPGVKAVVSSGYADNEVLSAHWSHGFRAMLNKPYEINALNETLNTLLD